MNRLAQVAAPLAVLIFSAVALAAEDESKSAEAPAASEAPAEGTESAEAAAPSEAPAEGTESAEAAMDGDPAAGKSKSTTCAACHGADGNSTDPQYPKIAQQHAGYTAKQLRDYHGGGRDNAVMAGMAQPLSEQDMLDLAAYFETQALTGDAAEAEQVERGQQLYRGGDLGRGVAACSACHGPTGRGNGAAGFPALAGQHAEYTEAQLMAFRSLQRHNDAGQMMRNVAGRMSDQDMKAVASYIAGLRE